MIKSSEFNKLLPGNINFILVNEEVLKFDKSIDFNELHKLNIFSILVTKEVLQFDKSIDSIFSTLLSPTLLKKPARLLGEY